MIYETKDLFGRRDLSQIKKEFKYLPLNYVGSKKQLLPWIWELIEQNGIEFSSMLDPFSGSGVVSYFMRLLDKTVYSNDLLKSSFYNCVSLVENPGVIVTKNELEWLASHTVENGVLNDKDFCYDDISHYNEVNFTENFLTLKEAIYIDCLLYKMKNMKDFFDLTEADVIYKQAICYSALMAFLNLLPFGSAGGSNFLEYRKRQKDTYNNRCKGFYMDEEYNLHLYWIANYIDKFSKFSLLAKNSPQGKAFNLNVFEFLNLDYTKDVDLVYFDPPYGGSTSDYSSMYAFLEQFITQDYISEEKQLQSKNFSLKQYEENFIRLLDCVVDIKYWIFSYNHRSWSTIDNISSVVGKYKRDVRVFTYHSKLQNRGNMTKGKDFSEFLIIAS